jgi:hypothetical protein
VGIEPYSIKTIEQELDYIGNMSDGGSGTESEPPLQSPASFALGFGGLKERELKNAHLIDVYVDPVTARYASYSQRKGPSSSAVNPLVEDMETTFAKENAQRFKGLIRKFGVLGLAVSIIFAYADAKRIYDEGGTPERWAVLAVKLALVIPIAGAWVRFSYSNLFKSHPQYIERMCGLFALAVMIWGQSRDSSTQYEKDIRAFVVMAFVIFVDLFTNW